MNSVSEKSPSRRRKILPPVVLLAAILLEIALDRWLPVADLWATSGRLAGGAVIAAALVVNIFCALEFRRRKTTIIPFRESSSLLTGGLYRFSRNPIYLSMAVLLIGVAIATGSASPWLVPPLFMWIITTRFIQHEEAMLTATFGDAYRAYCNRVRRWV
ncbi:MAG: isoprenylcysteine carboxylmethyltransferase family protein [Planctomycetes bacterium]|nr:isoprenylcysteine carboxylmethyltransferase family protein [Planctomycetota bacterium]